MYELGDYVVYPGHGVGQVINKMTQEINNQTLNIVSVKIVKNGMKMIVPEDSKEIRPLVCQKEIEEVFDFLQDHDIKPSRETWNRRHRDYMAKINTGSIIEVADVLKAILILKYSKKLSFGEKKVLGQCRDLIVQEISLSSGESHNDISKRIDSFFSEAK
jgi:CarD family transcriptional regulator